MDFPLNKIHCDLWGPALILSHQGFHHYAIFVDDCTRFSWLYPMKRKSGFYDCFLKFQKLVENHFERKIRIFQCDNAGEFTSNFFVTHLELCGIQQQLFCHGTPQSNGVVERKHRHIIETGLTMLFHAHLALKYWVGSFITAVYLINRLPSNTLNMQTP